MSTTTKTEKLQGKHISQTKNQIAHLRKSIANDQREIQEYHDKIKDLLDSVQKKNQELADAMEYLLDLKEASQDEGEQAGNETKNDL